MDQFKYMLSLEAKHQLKEEIIDRLLDNAKHIWLKKYEAIIDTGEYCPDIFIIKSGIIRGTYIQNNVEVTTGFALPGTVVISFHCYYRDVPSFLRFEACCRTEVLRISRAHFDNMIKDSHEFAIWAMSISQNQLFYNENRLRILSGDSQSRLKNLICKPAVTPSESPSEIISGAELDEGDNHIGRVRSMITNRWRDIFSTVPSKIIASYLGITEQHLSRIKKNILLDEKDSAKNINTD